MGLLTTNLMGPIPSPRSVDIFAYTDQLAVQRLARSPVERGRSIYVSSSAGSDTNNGLSPAAPFASLARVSEYLDTISNDLAVRFRAADTWYASVGIDCTKPEVSFSSYGSGAPPLLSAFIQELMGESFALQGDGTYAFAEEQVPYVVWIYNLAYPMRAYFREGSQTACAARPGSFFCDGVTIYIKPFADETFDENTRIRYMDADNSDDGIKIINADRCRIDGLMGYGWGMNATSPGTQAMPFSLAMEGSNEAVISNSGAYYSGTHLMAQYSPTGGGVATFYRNRIGYAHFAPASGETIYNAYGTNTSGFDFLMYENRTRFGTLPHHGWVTAGVTKRGVSVFGHHGTLATPAFAAVVRHVTEANEWGAEIPAGIEGYQSAETNPDAIKTIILEEKFEQNDRAGLGLGRSDYGTVRVNCDYLTIPADTNGQTFALVGANQFRAWWYNCKLRLDLSRMTQTISLVNEAPNGNTARGHLINCQVNLVNTPFVWAVIGSHDGWTANLGAQTEYLMCIFNSIIVHESGQALVVSGNGNNTNTLKNNAVFGVMTGGAVGNRWDGDANLITLGAAWPLGQRPSATVGANLINSGANLGSLAMGFDFNRSPRNTAAPTRGPLEPIKAGRPSILRPFNFGTRF